MAGKDDTTVTPPTAEYPEVADSISPPPAPPGWQGGDDADRVGQPIDADRVGQPIDADRVGQPIDADRIGQPVDPRDRGDRPAAVAPVSSGGGAMRGLFWLVATLGLVVAIALGARAVGVFPDFGNPFGEKQTDRSQPALLLSIQDLSRFVAAEGNFEVIVDVQDNRKYIPDFLVNDRILFVAAGSVEAYVDFANIGQGAVKESDERRTVEINLPAPELGKPSINNDRSYVYTQERGLFNRFGDVFSNDPNRLQEVYKLSEEKIAAAAGDSQLRQRAQENTRKMLEQLLRSLGYTSITVKFPAP